jgi:RND superfamily putative drug exporter
MPTPRQEVASNGHIPSHRHRGRRQPVQRLATWSHRHRWWALLVWVSVLVGVTVAAQAAGARYHNDFTLPGTQSQQALETLRQHAPVQAGTTVQVVVQDPDGLGTPRARPRVEAMLGAMAALPHVADVRSPYTGTDAVSRDGTIAYATVTLDGQSQDVPVADVRRIIDTAKAAAGDGLRVEVGGEAVTGAEEGGGGPAEGVGLLAALVILVFLFGSLRAASVPIVIAIVSVGIAIGLVVLASHVTTVADYTTLDDPGGLGVGIDYDAPFARYRASCLQRTERPRTALTRPGGPCSSPVARSSSRCSPIVLGLGRFRGCDRGRAHRARDRWPRRRHCRRCWRSGGRIERPATPCRTARDQG